MRDRDNLPREELRHSCGGPYPTGYRPDGRRQEIARKVYGTARPASQTYDSTYHPGREGARSEGRLRAPSPPTRRPLLPTGAARAITLQGQGAPHSTLVPWGKRWDTALHTFSLLVLRARARARAPPGSPIWARSLLIGAMTCASSCVWRRFVFIAVLGERALLARARNQV